MGTGETRGISGALLHGLEGDTANGHRVAEIPLGKGKRNSRWKFA